MDTKGLSDGLPEKLKVTGLQLPLVPIDRENQYGSLSFFISFP